MAQLDTLQINITATAENAIHDIDALIASLKRLEAQFNESKKIDNFAKNIGILSNGFKSLGDSINTLDAGHIKSVTNELKKLIDVSSSLNTKANLSPEELRKQAEWTDKLVSAETNKAEAYKRIKKTLAAIPNDLYVPEESLKMSDMKMEDIRKLLGGTNEAKSKHLIRGNAPGGNMAEMQKGLKTAYLNTDKLYNYSDVFDKFINYLKEEYDIIRMANSMISEMNENLSDVHGTMERMKSIEGTSGRSFLSDIFGDEDDDAIATMDSIKKPTEALENFVSAGQSTGANLSSLAVGLEALQGVVFTEGQFAPLGELGKMANSLAGAGNMSASFNSIAEGITQLSGLDFSQTENIQKIAKAINGFGYTSTSKAGENIKAMIDPLKELTTMTISTNNVQPLIDLASALGKFGSAGAGRAVQYLPQLAQGMIRLMTSMANAPRVSQETLRMAEAMAQFSQRASGVSRAINASNRNLNLFGTTARRHHATFGSLASLFGRLYANFFLLIRGFRMAKSAIEYSSQMTESMNVLDVAFGKSNGTMKDFMENSIRDFGIGRLAAAQYGSRFQAMAKTMGISAEEVGKAHDFISQKISGNELAYKDLGDSVADMSVNLTKLTADMASLYNQDFADVAQDMQSILTGQTKPLRKFGLDIGVASLKAFALKNGLDADIDSMTQAEKTMLRYQYVMANASGAMGDFQKTADTWANSMRTVKQLLQEFSRMLGEAFINAFKPALVGFKNFLYTLLELTEQALNALGSLLGWEKIDFGGASLAEDMDDYVESIDDATGAAKKLKGQLRGIDELNNLTTNKGGGGGGGGGSNPSIIGADIWEKINESKEKYKSDIKDWYDFGRRIATSIENGLKSVDWDAIQGKAKAGAENFANFLNGLFKPGMFGEIGTSIAEALNTGLISLKSFGETFDFINFGEAVKTGIINFLETFNWEDLADTIDTWVQGFFDFCVTVFGDKKLWKAMLDSAIKFVGNIDIETLEILATGFTLINTGLWVRNALSGALATALGTSALNLPMVGVILTGGIVILNNANEIKALLEGDEENYQKFLANDPAKYFSTQSEESYDFWYGLIEFMETHGITNFRKFYQIIQGIHAILTSQEFQTGMFLMISAWSKVKDSVKGFFDNLTRGISIIKASVETFYSKVINVVGAIAVAFEVFKREWKEFWQDPIKYVTGQSIEDIGKNIIDGVMKGITDQSGNITFQSVFDCFIKGFKQIFGIASPAKETEFIGEDIILGILEGFSLVDFANKMSEWWDKNVKPWFAIEKWKAIAGNIKSAIVGKWNETVILWIGKINSWWNQNVAPWFTLEKWSGIAVNIKTAIQNAWNSLVTWFKENVLKIPQEAENQLSYDTFFSIGEGVSKALQDTIGGVIQILMDAWGSLKNAFASGISTTVTVDTSQLQNMAETTQTAIEVTEQLIKLQEEQKKKDKTPAPANQNTSSSVSNIPSSVRKYLKMANGGFPALGSLFIAGESGSEFVGNINGRTGVASNMEITGIRDAIYSTSTQEMQLLRQQNQLLQGILEKEFGISKDALFKSVRSSASDYLRRTGTPAF